MGMRTLYSLASLTIAFSTLASSGCAAAPRAIDENRNSGYAVYRSGRLGARELAEMCELGVREIVVMDGAALNNECRWRGEICPGLKVRYNHAQDARTPVTREFLTAFDAWVVDSMAKGSKIAFRCRHGWHRAGRLSAYYRMRFDGWSAEAAIEEMLEMGRFMGSHPQLVPQVAGMADQLAARPCSQPAEHCPRDSPDHGEGLVRSRAGVQFADDLCDGAPGLAEYP